MSDTRNTLLNLISEYGDSLTRMDAERDLLKAMEDRAETECGMPAKAFRTAATAYHKDQVSKKREELNEQLDAFETIEGAPA